MEERKIFVWKREKKKILKNQIAHMRVQFYWQNIMQQMSNTSHEYKIIRNITLCYLIYLSHFKKTVKIHNNFVTF